MNFPLFDVNVLHLLKRNDFSLLLSGSVFKCLPADVPYGHVREKEHFAMSTL